VDAGCGEGYYSNRVAAAAEADVCGFDLSEFAVMAASKAAKRNNINAMFAVAGIFDMPLKDECADMVINLFAPCAEEEFKRVLKDGGILFVVGAGTDHLFGLKKAVYDEPYKNDPRNDLPVTMKHIGSHKVRFDITLSEREDRMALFAMTPYYYRTSRGDMEKLENAEGLVTEVEFDIEVYKK
jgi:23S rRNA (guanine745-N1)-methyltransferase